MAMVSPSFIMRRELLNYLLLKSSYPLKLEAGAVLKNSNSQSFFISSREMWQVHPLTIWKFWLNPFSRKMIRMNSITFSECLISQPLYPHVNYNIVSGHVSKQEQKSELFKSSLPTSNFKWTLYVLCMFKLQEEALILDQSLRKYE